MPSFHHLNKNARLMARSRMVCNLQTPSLDRFKVFSAFQGSTTTSLLTPSLSNTRSSLLGTNTSSVLGTHQNPCHRTRSLQFLARNAPRMHSSFGNNRIFSKSNSSFMAPSFHGNGCHMIAPIGSRSFSTGRKVKIVVLQQRVLKSFAKTAKYIVTACCVGINESSFSTVYVLQLKHGKKYVGYWSGDFAKCLKIHFSGHASKVTKKNPPDGCVVVLQQRVPKSFAQTAKYIVTACFVGIHGPDRVSGARISRSYSISRELKRFFGHHIAFGTPLGRSVIAAVRKWLPAKGTSKPSNKK